MSSVFTSSLRRRVLAPCALALVSAIVLSACGSSSTTSSSASASAAAGGGASSGSSSSTYEARLNYAKCMRSHGVNRSEEHTSELQSLRHLVCRLLLEKKNK